MDNTTLQRIYDLKTQGVDIVLADINKIASRLDYLGQVKKNVFDGAAMFGATEAFAQMTQEIKLQTDIQLDLLDNIGKMNAATEQGIALQGQMAASLGSVLQIQKGLKTNISDSKDVDYSNIARSVNDEISAKKALIGTYAELKKQMADTAAQRDAEAQKAAEAAQKQMAAGERMAAEVVAKNLKIAKSNIDAINDEIAAEEQLTAKQMAEGEKRAAAIEADMAKQEALAKKEAEADAKLQTALAKLKAEYKAAAAEAQELGAQQIMLQREADELSKIQAPSEQISYAVKAQQIAEMTPKLQEAQQKALDLSNALHGIELATGQGQRKVGQYNEAVQGLKDILRDSPSFANSFSTGLMGISNNIPMFLDGVRHMREQNAALVAEGKAPVSILKTLGSAFMDVGTLATLAVTAVTMFAMHMHESEKSAEDLKQSIDAVTQAITKEIEAIGKYNDVIEQGTKASEQAIKQELDHAKAVGVINEQKYNHEKDLFDKQNALFDKRKENLTQEKALYDDLARTVIASGGGRNFDKILNGAAPEGVSTQTLDYLRKQREKAKKNGVTDEQLYDSLVGTNGTIDEQQARLNAELQKLNDERTNAEAEFQAKYRLMAEQKHKELNEALRQDDETLRQLNEKEYFDSVDKITNDVLAKYNNMYQDLERRRAEYIKANPNDAEAIQKYEQRLANIRQQADRDRQNQVNAFLDQQAATGRGYAVSESQSAASIASDKAKNGSPLYKAYLDAATAETLAKKDAETKAYDDLYAMYVKNGSDTETLTKQHEDRMAQIDMEGYARRMAVANTFFKTLSEETDKVTAILTEKIDTKLLGELTAITSGGGSSEQKSHAKDMAEAQATIAKAQETLNGIDTKINDAEIAKSKDEAALKNAKTDAERTAAGNNLLAIEKEIADLLNQQAKAKNDIANATESMNAQEEAQRKEVRDILTNGALDVAKAAADAELQLLAAQDAARDRSAQKQMAWNQKLLASQAQSKQQQLANEKAFMVQQEQMEKEKAIRAQQRAKAQMVIEYATAALRIVAANIYDPAQWPQMAAEEAILAATYAAKLAILSSTPAYADGTPIGGHPGGTAVVGDGRKKEIIEIGGQYFLSPDKATSTWLPKGANVIPDMSVTDMTKIGTFAYPGTMGAQLKAPTYFTNSTAGGSTADARQAENYADSFAAIQNTMMIVMSGLQNMNVNLDTNKLSSRMAYNTTKKVNI